MAPYLVRVYSGFQIDTLRRGDAILSLSQQCLLPRYGATKVNRVRCWIDPDIPAAGALEYTLEQSARFPQ